METATLCSEQGKKQFSLFEVKAIKSHRHGGSFYKCPDCSAYHITSYTFRDEHKKKKRMPRQRKYGDEQVYIQTIRSIAHDIVQKRAVPKQTKDSHVVSQEIYSLLGSIKKNKDAFEDLKSTVALQASIDSRYGAFDRLIVSIEYEINILNAWTDVLIGFKSDLGDQTKKGKNYDDKLKRIRNGIENATKRHGSLARKLNNIATN